MDDWSTLSLASPDHGHGLSYGSQHHWQHGTSCGELQSRTSSRHTSVDFQRAMSVGSSGSPSATSNTAPRNAVLLTSLLQSDDNEELPTPNYASSDRQWSQDSAPASVASGYGQMWGHKTPVTDGNLFRGNSHHHQTVTDDGVASSVWNGFTKPNEIPDDVDCFLPASEMGRIGITSSSPSLYKGNHVRARNGRQQKLSSSCSPVESFIDDLNDGCLTPLSPPITSNVILDAFAMKSEPPASPWPSASLTTPAVHKMNSLIDLGSDGCQSAETSPLATSADEGPASSSESWWWPLDRSSTDFDLAESISSNAFIQQHSVGTSVADGGYTSECYHGDESSAAEVVEGYVGMGDNEVECDLSMFNLVGVEVADGDGNNIDTVYHSG